MGRWKNFCQSITVLLRTTLTRTIGLQHHTSVSVTDTVTEVMNQVRLECLCKGWSELVMIFGSWKGSNYNRKLLGERFFKSLPLTFLSRIITNALNMELIFTFRSIKLSFGLQEFQLGIITEDTMGQVPQFVAG